ncbi:MAG: hypothetical protein NT159_24615 [Proteobacteria bacterium]|nr:hypothetical protein [Pseudomonadota bacterium]
MKSNAERYLRLTARWLIFLGLPVIFVVFSREIDTSIGMRWAIVLGSVVGAVAYFLTYSRAELTGQSPSAHKDAADNRSQLSKD